MKITIDTHEDVYDEWQHVKNLIEDQYQMRRRDSSRRTTADDIGGRKTRG